MYLIEAGTKAVHNTGIKIAKNYSIGQDQEKLFKCRIDYRNVE